MIAFLRRLAAIRRMSRHERWRVAMGCPGVGHLGAIEPDTPRLGEVYCRCESCRRDRQTAGCEPLRGELG